MNADEMIATLLPPAKRDNDLYIDPVRQYKITVVVDQNKLQSLNGIEVSFSGE